MWTYECGICAEDYNEEEKPHYADGTPVCLTCVNDELVPKFKAALQYEEQYPPPWGNAFLDVKAFKDVLGDDFVAKYEAKEQLYAIPIRLRRYCKHRTAGSELCNTILSLPRPVLPDGGANLVCSSCERETCPSCEVPIDPQTPHDCTQAVLTADQETGLEGLRRGQDYQICPGEQCGVLVQLSEACNHMTCNQPRCRTEFCFLCGARATVPSGHWNPGMPCPLYGREPQRVHAWRRVRQALNLPNNPDWDAIPPTVLIHGSERAGFEDDVIMHFDLLLNKMADWTERHQGSRPGWVIFGLRERIWATVAVNYFPNSQRIRRAVVSAIHPLGRFHIPEERMPFIFLEIASGVRDFIADHMNQTARMVRSIRRHVGFTELEDLRAEDVN